MGIPHPFHSQTNIPHRQTKYPTPQHHRTVFPSFPSINSSHRDDLRLTPRVMPPHQLNRARSPASPSPSFIPGAPVVVSGWADARGRREPGVPHAAQRGFRPSGIYSTYISRQSLLVVRIIGCVAGAPMI
ncbi:uncharacterized protein BKA78DRAFT_24122 [Phyllosticta capitalensis]|uniref:uncharacterized protein n=1 Tax=Phyllosticta capitalensis TaxID=121624 RepID=UPI003131A6C5